LGFPYDFYAKDSVRALLYGGNARRDRRSSIAQETLSDLAGRIRARTAEFTSITASSPLDTAIRDQLK
jgi:hypothetical protein